MHLSQGRIQSFKNPNKLSYDQNYPEALKSILDIKHVKQAVLDIKAWPNYKVTPLIELHEICQDIGLKKIWYKDESSRFGLGSFKALGGAYAVALQIQKVLKTNHDVQATIPDLISGQYAELIKDISVSCATDGNHGRSVAWGAQLFGCECVIYLHKHVSKGRENAIAKYGAKIVRIEGNYDESVRLAAAHAQRYNRLIVSDTSYPGYMDIPKDVALGYTVMFEEIVQQLQGDIPTHLIVQGGVGGLASAACAYFWQVWKDKRPTLILVEPEQANCLQESAKHNKPTVVEGELETLMAGLACGEVSALAWEILSVGTDYFITINEETIAPTMKLLAHYDIEAGESAVPGLAAIMVGAKEGQFDLNEKSKVLVLGTEGATDPQVYERLTGIQLRK